MQSFLAMLVANLKMSARNRAAFFWNIAFPAIFILIFPALFGSGIGGQPSVGIIVGGLVGPAVGLLVPAATSHETAPIGTQASAERYSMPGTHLADHTDRPLTPPDEGDRR